MTETWRAKPKPILKQKGTEPRARWERWAVEDDEDEACDGRSKKLK